MQNAAVIAGWSLLAVGAFLGIAALAWWGSNGVEKARDRAARREWDAVIATLPGYDEEAAGRLTDPNGIPVLASGDGWPAAGTASRHFFGTDEVPFDPEAEATEFIRRMKADTAESIRKMRADTAASIHEMKADTAAFKAVLATRITAGAEAGQVTTASGAAAGTTRRAVTAAACAGTDVA
jgi:hypothetical protein